MKPSREFRKQFEAFGDAEFLTIPRADFAECIGSLDAMEQVALTVRAHNKELEMQIQSVESKHRELELQALRISAERDALAEIHKQIFMEVFNAKVRDAKDSETKSPSPQVHKS